MPTAIPNVTIFAPVIQFKNDLYLTEGQYTPRTLNIPCGINALVDDQETWVVPVKDHGICTVCSFVPAINDYPPGSPPTPDSLLTIRVRDKYNRNYWWYVIATRDQYYASCAACCGDTPVPIPDPTLPIIVPCQNVCEATDDDGNYYVTFGAPTLGAGEEYSVYGQYNGEDLNSFSSTSLDDLVSDLNSEYGTIGSPSVDIVWTRNGNTIIGTFQDGDGEDGNFCLMIIAEIPSP